MNLEQAKKRESHRLEFVIGHGGVGAATAFAKQTIRQYRKAVLTSRKRGHAHPSHASLPEYRGLFIASYVVLKKFVRENRGIA